MKGLLVVLVALIVISMVVALIMALMFAVAVGLAIGLPAYLLLRHRTGISQRFNRLTENPMERLQNLYVDGKIDLFEFERRVAQLIAIEH